MLDYVNVTGEFWNVESQKTAPCGFFYLLFSSLNLSGRRLDVYHISTQGCDLSANLECRSEMCCTRLAENTGRKNDAKNRHLGTIPQLCRAMSSQL